MNETAVWTAVAVLLGGKLAAQFILEWVNRRHVQAHAGEVPAAFRGRIDHDSYTKSVQYTLAKSRFHLVELTWDTAFLAMVLGSGILAGVYKASVARWGESAFLLAAWLCAVAIAFSIASLPLDWYRQFRLEERFNFNTSTASLWWMDRLKGAVLSVAIGLPLLWVILRIVDWAGAWWWLYAWGTVLGFQLVMTVLAPIFILPLFNKFQPLPDGSLRDRLLDLAHRTGFKTGTLQVMDGSKRSRHSNAFFTGFGRFRRIVLFDTLLQHLEAPEVEAVLAHEIGHYKRKHIPKALALTSLGTLAGFAFIAWLAGQAWFYKAFGFPTGNIAPALLMFSLLSGSAGFWISPVANWWSRKNEYEADSFAADATHGPGSLVSALRKLNEKNASNLTPHPAYSTFYYSHPALLEREAALMRLHAN